MQNIPMQDPMKYPKAVRPPPYPQTPRDRNPWRPNAGVN